MNRYFGSFFIALSFYVLFAFTVFYFFFNEKIIIKEPNLEQTISLKHIELKEKEEKLVEDKVLENSIQEEKKEEPIIPEKPIETTKPIIKKEIVKKVQEKPIEKKKVLVEKEIKKPLEKVIEKPVEKETKQEIAKANNIVEDKTVDKDIQVQKTTINDNSQQEIVNEKKDYLDKHLAQIRNLINQNVKYPNRARKLSIEGVVTVKFKINEDGTVGNITIIDGHKFLQSTTIEAIEEASKSFPKINKSIEIQIPIEYKLI